jgi:hypothetical protein
MEEKTKRKGIAIAYILGAGIILSGFWIVMGAVPRGNFIDGLLIMAVALGFICSGFFYIYSFFYFVWKRLGIKVLNFKVA